MLTDFVAEVVGDFQDIAQTSASGPERTFHPRRAMSVFG
jgi:hypothetical protein